MEITIEQIKALRDATGVSMTACKKALEEANGDFDGAVDVLRKRGEAKAADKVGRSTAQGAIAAKIMDGRAALVELLCETDFVSLGDEFKSMAEMVAEKVIKGEISETNKDLPELKEAMLRLGENIQVGKTAILSGADVYGDYIHSNRKIGVVVALEGGDTELAKDIAMHAAATNPAVISPEEISDEMVAREKSIWEEQLKNEGKPAEIVEKIMLGKEKKFREENALLKQQFVKDPDKTIEQLLSAKGAKLKAFERFAI